MKNKQRKALTLSFSLLLVMAFASLTLLPEIGAARVGDVAIGAKVEDFTLNDVDGKARSLKSLMGKNGAVLVFVSAQCPVVKAYNARIEQLAKDYQSKGISVIGINSNSTETPERVKAHTAEFYTFPVLLDPGNKIADKLGANVTPEMYYFDASGKLAYRGAIDNDQKGDNITSNYLRDALEASLAGKAIAKAEAKAFGCSIKRASK